MSSPSPTTDLDARRWRMLAVALVAMFMAIFDFFVINVAAPSLRSELHAGPAALELIIGAYTFTYASLLVYGGRLGDMYSYRRLFIAGMSLFTLASLGCSIASDDGQLIAVRLVQGVGSALMVPQVVALIQVVFPPFERPKALAWFGVVVGLASVAGQVLGGALLQLDVAGLGWRAIFVVNVPIGVVTVAAAAHLLPEIRAQRRPKQDPVGTAGVSATLALAILPLILGHSEGWPLWGWIMLAASVPVGLATVLYQRALPERGGEPILAFGVMRRRSFAVGVLTIVGMMSFYSGFIFGLTLFLQSGLGLDPLQAGLTFCPMGLGFAGTSLLARPLVIKRGAIVISAGQGLLAFGTLSLLTLLFAVGTDVTAVMLIAPMFVIGLGTGLTIPSLTGIVVSQVPPQQAGLASGMLTTTQQFANTIGVAVFGAIFFDAIGDGPDFTDYLDGLEWVAGTGLGLCALTLACSFLLPRRVAAPLAPPPTPAPPATRLEPAPAEAG